MFLLDRVEQFFVKFLSVNALSLKPTLHNLKIAFHRKPLCNFFLFNIRKRLRFKAILKKLKVQMKAVGLTKSNLKAESSTELGQIRSHIDRSAAAMSKPLRGQEEKDQTDGRCRYKESITAGNSTSYNKRSLSVASSSHQYNIAGAMNTQHIVLNPFSSAYVYRSLSDSFIQSMDYSKKCSSNRYRMYRSDTTDSMNITQVAARDRQQAWNLRTWQRTLYGKKCSKQVQPKNIRFKIMSYNVLAQELLTEHSYLYRQHHSQALSWEQRWHNILEEIKMNDADILCLQEVQASHLNSNYSELNKLGYDGLFKERTGRRTDGCAIYFRRSVFNLLEYTTVEFNQEDVTVLNRDNVAIVAKFAPKNNIDNEFIVATTHLLYNPRREDVRLAQTQVLLSEIDRMAFKKMPDRSIHIPIILTGDFNLTPSSVVYELITQGHLEYENLTNRSLSRSNYSNSTYVTGKELLPSFMRITDQCQHADLVELRKNEHLSREEEFKFIQLQHSDRDINSTKCSKDHNNSWFSSGTLSHHLAFGSAYEHRHGRDVEATTFQDKWVTVDYIFYSGTKSEDGLVLEDKLKLMSRYALPTSEPLAGVRIPNFAFGSDHFSLIVKFELSP